MATAEFSKFSVILSAPPSQHHLSGFEIAQLELNVDILGISELKWIGMDEFNSDDHYIYYCGQESLRRYGVAFMVSRTVQNAVLRHHLRNDRMISVRFQGKPFNIMVIQAHEPTSNTEEAEVEWFYEDLQDLLELTPKKDVLFIMGDWNEKEEVKKHLE